MQNSENIQKTKTQAIDIQIIVPVYNVEQYLDEFFRCVLNQTIQNFIIIAVNDASTDGSYQKLEECDRDDFSSSDITCSLYF